MRFFFLKSISFSNPSSSQIHLFLSNQNPTAALFSAAAAATGQGTTGGIHSSRSPNPFVFGWWRTDAVSTPTPPTPTTAPSPASRSSVGFEETLRGVQLYQSRSFPLPRFVCPPPPAAEKTLEVDQPKFADCRSLLRAGPAASLRVNIRAFLVGKLEAKYGEDLSNAPPIDRSAWLEAVGGSKKGRVFGTGESSRKFAESIHSTSSVTSTERTATTKEPVEAVVDRRLDGFQEQMNQFQNGFQEQMHLFQNQLGYMMQMMMSQYGAQQRPSDYAAHPPFQPQMMTSVGQLPFPMQPQMTRPTNGPSSSQQWQQMYPAMG
ncbi:hypothetical protein Tsubulata_005915 [Turnera subulata]|uniref:DUF7880 domain-containing protein n=1 Tax=Turnera subulata TaxID=218843 RepID=A0A9Q0GA90_9ROSI|nr:hypothetical protein Tsubulata_005915 [Turnera subulata]